MPRPALVSSLGPARAQTALAAALVTLIASSPSFAYSKIETSTLGSGPPVLTPAEAAKAAGAPAASPEQSVVPPPAPQGACAYSTLTSAVSQSISVITNFQFTQTRPFWCAVGVRPAPSDDWDLTVNDATGPSPGCVSTQLASSTGGTGVTDFIVGDFNHNTQKSYYPQVYPFAASSPATVEWDDGPDAITINDFGIVRLTDASDVLECFDVFLTVGNGYAISIGDTGGADIKLYFFRNPASAPAWIPRSGALFTLTSNDQGVEADYTSPASDWYSIVVVNENGGTGQYGLRVDSCINPTVLVSGVSQLATRAPTSFMFTQSTNYWSAAAVRAMYPPQNWDIALWRNYALGQPYAAGCWTSNYDWSQQGLGKVDLVTIDFNYTPLATVYVEGIPTGLTNTYGRVEWDDGADLFNLNGTPILVPTDSLDIVTMWDVFLESGHTYRIEFSAHSTNGGAAPDCWALLFRNHQGAFPYSSTRQFADVQTQTNALYMAPTTGYYGLAVINDDGGTGTMAIGMFENNGVDVPPGPRAFTTRLVSLSPNPSAAATRIEFELAQRARVGFELVDVAGRVCRRLDAETFEAGPANTTLRLRGGDLGPGAAPAGVYFLRMVVDGRPVATKRLIVFGQGAS